jgi:Uri superfamily endonuclease
MKGSYVLLIELKTDKIIEIGKLGKLFFKKGFYAYVGSAMNSLNGRINRHLRLDKKIHWHIDYFLKHAEIINVFYKETNKKIECEIAGKLGEKLESITDFGCSDCKCKSHFFYGKKYKIFEEILNSNMWQFQNFT